VSTEERGPQAAEKQKREGKLCLARTSPNPVCAPRGAENGKKPACIRTEKKKKRGGASKLEGGGGGGRGMWDVGEQLGFEVQVSYLKQKRRRTRGLKKKGPWGMVS